MFFTYNQLLNPLYPAKDQFSPNNQSDNSKMKAELSEKKEIKFNLNDDNLDTKFNVNLVDINKIFDDIPIGQKIFKYVIFAPKLPSQIKNIRKKLNTSNRLDYIINEILSDIEAYFDNKEIIKYEFKYILDNTAKNFYDTEEEEKHDYDLKSLFEIDNNLHTLGIKYVVNSLIQDKDSNGKMVSSSPVEIVKNNKLKI